MSTPTDAEGREPIVTRTRVTRDEWVQESLATLRTDGVEHVRVLTIAKRLDVARSSFYWYFQSRETLLGELLEIWSTSNTTSIVERAGRPADTITAAVLGIFECWADGSVFDPQLDFAIRDWATRDPAVAAAVAAADDARVDAISSMYARHGFADPLVWARVLYLMQVGYYALGVVEPIAVRLAYAPAYVRALTGHEPSPDELQRFEQFLGRDGSTRGREIVDSPAMPSARTHQPSSRQEAP